MKTESTFKVKKGLAEMLKGGVIMDVVNAEQAKIAEKSGAVAVMALERIPADIRAEGGVSRMSSVEVIQEVMDTVSIPVMAKARIGHFVEAQMLEELGIDFIDESEVLTPADDVNHISKHDIKTPFVNGATNIGEACRRIGEGAAMIRTKRNPALLLPIEGDTILYLGAGHGTSVSHLHDHLCGQDNHQGGRLVCVDLATRCLRDLTHLAKYRPGLIPVF